MRIAEIFRSIQGEGRLTGTESLFIRASGCNLRCAFCDTPYASSEPEGQELSPAEILDRLARLDGSGDCPDFRRDHRVAMVGEKRIVPFIASEPVHYVVLTGGEPMLFADAVPLCEALHAQRRHITVETSGTAYLPVVCDLMSISPKLSNSVPGGPSSWSVRHEAARHVPEVIRRLMREYDYQVKFVIDRPEDCREVELYLADVPEIDRGRVMLMPEGVDPAALTAKAAWLRPYCESHDLQFCPRRQIEWFGPGRGK